MELPSDNWDRILYEDCIFETQMVSKQYRLLIKLNIFHELIHALQDKYIQWTEKNEVSYMYIYI